MKNGLLYYFDVIDHYSSFQWILLKVFLYYSNEFLKTFGHNSSYISSLGYSSSYSFTSLIGLRIDINPLFLILGGFMVFYTIEDVWTRLFFNFNFEYLILFFNIYDTFSAGDNSFYGQIMSDVGLGIIRLWQVLWNSLSS